MMPMLAEIRNAAAGYLSRPAVQLLARTRITPNIISWFGFLLALAATALIVTGHVFAAGLVVLVAGFFDMLDGALARLTNQATRFGGILDSILDRFAEAAVLLGIMVLYLQRQSVGEIILVGLALLGSLMVSYIRARAEAAGLKCKVGFFTRTERVVILALGLLLSQINYALTIALAIIVLLSFFTIIQRLLFVWRQTRDD